MGAATKFCGNWDNRVSLETATATAVYVGPRGPGMMGLQHLFSVLIVCCRAKGHEMIFDFQGDARCNKRQLRWIFERRGMHRRGLICRRRDLTDLTAGLWNTASRKRSQASSTRARGGRRC